MKKLLIATLAAFFFIGMVQADDEPVEPEVIKEVIEEVLEEPTAEPTEEAIEEVVIEEVIEELVIEEPVIEEVVEEEHAEEVKYIFCKTTYLVSENSKGVAVFEHYSCMRTDGNGEDGYTIMVAQFANTVEYYGD